MTFYTYSFLIRINEFKLEYDIHNSYLVQKMELKVGIKYFLLQSNFLLMLYSLARDINVQKGNIALKLIKFKNNYYTIYSV